MKITEQDQTNIGIIYENMNNIMNNSKQYQRDIDTIIMPFLNDVSDKNPQNILNKLRNIPEAAQLVEDLLKIRQTLFDWMDPNSKYNASQRGRVESLSAWVKRNRINVGFTIMPVIKNVNTLLSTIKDPQTVMILRKLYQNLTKIKSMSV